MRRTNSRIQESRENYYYDSATEEKWKFVNSKLREKTVLHKHYVYFSLINS